MQRKVCFFRIILLTGLLLVPAGPSPAQDLERSREKERIHGSQLMSGQELAKYRARMRAAASEEERETIRLEHHLLLQERTAARGITLPDEPPEGGGAIRRSPGGGSGRGRPR